MEINLMFLLPFLPEYVQGCQHSRIRRETYATHPVSHTGTLFFHSV